MFLKPTSENRRFLGEIFIFRIFVPGNENLRERMLELPEAWLKPEFTREFGVKGVVRLPVKEVVGFGGHLP